MMAHYPESMLESDMVGLAVERTTAIPTSARHLQPIPLAAFPSSRNLVGSGLLFEVDI